MSPNSSSTCRSGAEHPLGDAANHLSLPLLGSRSVVGRTLRDAPPAYATAAARTTAPQAVTARHLRWYRGAIVRGGRKGFWRVPRRAPRRPPGAACIGARALVRRSWRARCCWPAAAAAAASGRERTGGHVSRCRCSTRASPRSSRSRARRRLVLLVRNTGTTHGAERRGHDRLVRLHLELSRTGRRQAPGVGDRTRPRGDRLAARRKRGNQPARRRSDGLRQHLGARPARARQRRARSSGTSCRSSQAPTPSTTPSPPGSPARPKRGSSSAASCRGSSSVEHRPAPPSSTT